MLSTLGISVEFVTEPTTFETLIVVDGQYGAGNVRKFEAQTVVVIDHHREEMSGFDMSIINSGLGSCSTLVWDLMRKQNFPFDKYPHVCTALYYGLFTDTSSLQEIHHPLDKDMRDSLSYSTTIIKRLQNTNLSLPELNIVGEALNQYTNDYDLHYAIFKSEPCDPNILGFISDLVLQVDIIDTCIVYNHTPDGAKLSLRCCTREIMASDFATFITRDVGSGGGHRDKAGGFISKAKVEALGKDLDKYIEEKTMEYFTSYDIVDSASHNLDIKSMVKYKKNKLPVGYVRSVDVFPQGTPVMIRALEGDENIIASDDVYIMVGILGEVYPITFEKWQKSYTHVDVDANERITKYTYSPTAWHRITAEVRELESLAKSCVALGDIYVYAQQLTRDTKVFTSWNIDGYMYGRAGDYIVVRSDDPNDVYIIREDIFDLTYAKV